MSAGAYMAASKALDNKGVQIALPILVLGTAWLGWRHIVAPFLETIGVKDTRNEAESKALQERIEKLKVDKDYWSPTFFQKPPAGYTAMILDYKSSDSMAKKLMDAKSIYNDDEPAIYAVFRSCKYKSQVSYLVYWFNRLYQLDLYTWLKDKVLNDDELKVVLTITEKLPNGFKNLKTGGISGI